jgi:hypothetical protein
VENSDQCCHDDIVNCRRKISSIIERKYPHASVIASMEAVGNLAWQDNGSDLECSFLTTLIAFFFPEL